MLVILSGVAGAGKNTIQKEIIKRMENVVAIPSFTDRPIRPGDVPGETYNFVSTEEFERMIKDGELYEYDIHHNHYYGTSRKVLNDKIKEGKVSFNINIKSSVSNQKELDKIQIDYNNVKRDAKILAELIANK